jgi:hypothetical protein
MAQAVEHLPSKPEALSSNTSTDKKREKKEIWNLRPYCRPNKLAFAFKKDYWTECAGTCL